MRRSKSHMKRLTVGKTRGSGFGTKSRVGGTNRPSKRLSTRGGRGH